MICIKIKEMTVLIKQRKNVIIYNYLVSIVKKLDMGG